MNLFNSVTVSDICVIQTSQIRNHQHSVMTDRPFLGLALCRAGRILYRQNGKEFLSDRDHVIFYPQGSTYEWDSYSEGQFPMINFYGGCDPAQSELLSLQTAEMDALLADHAVLERLFLFEKEQSRAELLSIVYRILARLAGNDRMNPALPVLTPAIRYLEEHYADPALTNAALAECAKISEVYFRRLFREAYGVTPGQYVQRIRLRKAKQLLTETSLPVSAVAADAGYASVYHFCRIFHAKTGCTPTGYRAQFSLTGL